MRFTLDTVEHACFEVDETGTLSSHDILATTEAQLGMRELLVVFGADLALHDPLRFRVIEVSWYDRWKFARLPRCSLEKPLRFTVLGKSVHVGCLVASDAVVSFVDVHVVRVKPGTLCSPLLAACGKVVAQCHGEYILDTVRCVFEANDAHPFPALASDTPIIVLFHCLLGTPSPDEIPRMRCHYACVPGSRCYDVLNTYFTCAAPLPPLKYDEELVLPPPPVWNGRADGFVCPTSGIFLLCDRPELFCCSPDVLRQLMETIDSPLELHIECQATSGIFSVYNVTSIKSSPSPTRSLLT